RVRVVDGRQKRRLDDRRPLVGELDVEAVAAVIEAKLHATGSTVPWFQVPRFDSSRFIVPGSWFGVHGAGFMVRNIEPGTDEPGAPEPGTFEPGTWNEEPGTSCYLTAPSPSVISMFVPQGSLMNAMAIPSSGTFV